MFATTPFAKISGLKLPYHKETELIEEMIDAYDNGAFMVGGKCLLLTPDHVSHMLGLKIDGEFLWLDGTKGGIKKKVHCGSNTLGVQSQKSRIVRRRFVGYSR